MSTGKKVVWILGAGFSAGLGGPLLWQLLSERALNDVAHRYPPSDYPLLHDPVAGLVRPLYWSRVIDDRLRDGGRRLQERVWSNAEDFLDFLDTATVDRMLKGRLETMQNGSGHSAKDLSVAARRLIAAECSSFLGDTTPRREQWNPYFRWANELIDDHDDSDTIVTFNYDRVLETLFEGARSKPVVLLPDDKPDAWKDHCPVLKLHGSVDWRKKPEGGYERSEPLFALKGPATEIVMATPGPTKAETVTADLELLWQDAERSLNDADAIVFLGYRFPETDAQARTRLLDAIRANKKPNTTLPIHVVLGSSPESDRHGTRLESMLRFVCEAAGRRDRSEGIHDTNFRISVHPLFAQDFLSVVRRLDLLASR